MKRSFSNFLNCHSGSRLDEFAARLFDFKKEGTYVDIGSQHSMFHNNSYYLDVHLDWRGMCLDIDSSFNETFENRKHCTLVNKDCMTVDYKQLFIDCNFPPSIDYLSLDVDVLDLEVAKILPLNDYRFKIIGVEHDFYQHGDKYRAPQREFFVNAGYTLVCADIYVRNPDFDACSFEDWYLDPTYFSQEVITKLTSVGCYPEDVIDKLLIKE